MADVTLIDLLISNPVSTALTGEEPLETVVSSASEAARIRQLSFAPLNAQTGTAYTLEVTDQGAVVTMDNVAANTVTLPLDSTADLPIGASLLVRQIGSGNTNFVAEVGVTLNFKATTTLFMSERHGQAVIHKTAADTYHICGELAAL